MSKQIGFTAIEQGSMCNIKKTDYYIIQTKAEWSAHWAKHSRDESAPPKVDFRNNVVVAIYMGQKSSAGFSIEVDRIEDNGTDLIIHTKTERPTGFAATVMTQPFSIIKLRKPRERTIRVGGLR